MVTRRGLFRLRGEASMYGAECPGFRALATVRGASLVEEAEIKRLRASGGCLGTERR
jgi:hypothetical protein